MSNSEVIQFGQTITLEEAAELILATPEVRYMLRGEPGIGKSSLFNTLVARTGYPGFMVDVPNLDLGDVGIPMPNREEHVTEYFPNKRFGLHLGTPVVIVLDEFTKGMEPVKNMLHPLLEASNPRLGDLPLPEGSIVVMTGNLTTDGVGDNLKAHSRNRVTELHISKPTAEQWLGWGAQNDISPVVLAWVNQVPHCMASYTEPGQDGNPYIYNPRKMQTAYVSPRSLERASHVVKARDRVGAGALIAALKGTIGEAAARDMEAFIHYQDELPKWESILKAPTRTALPKSPAAAAVLVFGAVERIETVDQLEKLLTYMDRMESEWQAVFCTHAMKHPRAQRVAFNCERYTNWAIQNQDIL